MRARIDGGGLRLQPGWCGLPASCPQRREGLLGSSLALSKSCSAALGSQTAEQRQAASHQEEDGCHRGPSLSMSGSVCSPAELLGVTGALGFWPLSHTDKVCRRTSCQKLAPSRTGFDTGGVRDQTLSRPLDTCNLPCKPYQSLTEGSFSPIADSPRSILVRNGESPASEHWPKG